MRKKRIGLREKLEEENTLLSNERTMLSYIRTSFAAFLFGFAFLQFGSHSPRFLYVGYVAVGIGLLFLIIGLIHFGVMKRKIRQEVGDIDE